MMQQQPKNPRPANVYPAPESETGAPPQAGSVPESATWQFRLFVAGNAPHSRSAIANLQTIGDRFLPGKFTVEIVDVLKEPLRTLEDDVYVTPTLIRLSPEPVCRIIGNLSDQRLVLLALGLEDKSNG